MNYRSCGKLQRGVLLLTVLRYVCYWIYVLIFCQKPKLKCVSQLELLQEDLSYATDEVERLSKVVEEQAALLESSRTLNTEKENKINTLEEQVLPLLP